MQNKTCLVKTVIRKEIREKDGYHYEYELSVRRSRSVASYNIPLYSLSVKMKGKETTSAKLCDCFSDESKAMRFFNTLVSALATPGNLIYVFEDMIDT